jgi:8-oxo-dGTP diphosphatase
MKKEYERPSVTVDIILFTYAVERLQVLLIRRGNAPFAGVWALPGGFVDIDESLETAATRELFEETGMQDVFLEQLATFGDPDRDPRGRVISVAYIAIAGAGIMATTRAGDDASAAAWFDVYNLPRLAFDHDHILSVAVQRLRYKFEYTTHGLHLLPDLFTLTELQKVYEIVLEKTFDKRNFRRKFLSLGILEDTGQVRYGDYRPAKLYRKIGRPVNRETSKSVDQYRENQEAGIRSPISRVY